MIKVGVIGVGSIGQHHARVYFHSDFSALKAVADSSTASLEKVSQRYAIPGYSDYREMLRKENLDAVSIAVPTSLHTQVTLEAIKAGKHILLEKPIAPTVEEAKQIIAAAEKQGIILMIGHIERFNPAIGALKECLQRGELGEVYKIDVQRIGPFPDRITDVGVIIDLSVHDLDIVSYLIEDSPLRLYAETQRRLHPTHEDLVTALIRYKKGALAVLNINYLSPTKIRQLKIFGKKGMFLVNYLDQELYFYENKGYTANDWESVSEGDMKKIIIPKKEPLQCEIETFLHCLKENKQPPVTGEQGLRVLHTAHALMRSAQEKKILEWGEGTEV